MPGEFICRFQPIFAKLGRALVTSHTVKVKVEYRDPEALKRAVLAMGGIWYGHGLHDLFDTKQTGYGFRLPMKNGYHQEAGGTYWYHPLVLCDDGSLAYDAYGGAWGDISQVEKLQRQYADAMVEQAAVEQGWQFERQADKITIYHSSGGILVWDGTTLDQSGFTGSMCHDAAMAILTKLGREQEITLKPEYAAVAASVQLSN